jgi:hypothetical protein
MATVTPNFGWPVPTSTDLVKDGATAMEALGDAIDTSMVDLKGGTTGQVLAKASNTDMDFSWVAQDDSNAIQNSIVDAKGDLIAASAADTPARLAVGANGETLVADSSTSTGLRYTAGTVQSNPIINSAMQVWQRGTSIVPTTTSFGPDRWQVYRGTTGSTVSRQATGDTTNLPNIQYCARVQRDSGNTATNPIYVAQNLETINAVPFAGKTVTFSFYARRGANFSAQLNYRIDTGTGTDQNLLTGYTGAATIGNTDVTLTTTWARYSVTATIAATATEFGLLFGFVPTGTAGAADYYEVTGVQIDIGSVALPFRTYAGTIQGELAACQRYYYRQGGQTYSPFAQGWVYNSTGAANLVRPPVTMRVVPTAIDYSGTIVINTYAGSYTVSSTSISSTESSKDLILLNSASTGMTAGQPSTIRASNDASAYIGLSAEL